MFCVKFAGKGERSDKESAGSRQVLISSSIPFRKLMRVCCLGMERRRESQTLEE